MKTKRLSIGIVGGLNPLVAADICFKAMKHVKCGQDGSDYPDIIISSAFEQELQDNRAGDTPRQNHDISHRILCFYQAAWELKEKGADRILVPDFESRPYAHTISERIKAPLYDIVEMLATEILSRWPGARKIGLLASTFSIRLKAFDAKFAEMGLNIIYPDKDVQENMIMEAVYGVGGIKRGIIKGKSGDLIRKACEHLYSKGSDIIASAIAELPLIEKQYYPKENYLDCNEAIACELVKNTAFPESKLKEYTLIGILGELGAMDVINVVDKIVKNIPASCGQNRIRIIMENIPQISKYSSVLNEKHGNPGVAMLAAAEKLQNSGVDFIIVPGNAEHVFLEKVRRHTKIPILGMIEETVKYIAQIFPDIKKAGLLAGAGTDDSQVYKNALNEKGIELIVPSTESQNLLMNAINGKAGSRNRMSKTLLLNAARAQADHGAQIIILGCTEIPLVLKNGDMDIPFVDTTEILAKAAIKQALDKPELPQYLPASANVYLHLSDYPLEYP